MSVTISLDDIREHNRLIDEFCEKNRLYPKLQCIEFKSFLTRLYTFSPFVWAWLAVQIGTLIPDLDINNKNRILEKLINNKLQKDFLKRIQYIMDIDSNNKEKRRK